MKLMSIAMRPLCEPPFPLERIEEMTELMAGDGNGNRTEISLSSSEERLIFYMGEGARRWRYRSSGRPGGISRMSSPAVS